LDGQHQHFTQNPVAKAFDASKSPNPRITSRSQLPSTPVVRRDCLARALPRRLGNLQDVAKDVASFAPQISRITVLGGNLPNPSDPKGQSTWWVHGVKGD